MEKRICFVLMILLCPWIVFGLENVLVSIKEWQVPWDGTRPRDPFVGPKGLVWFVGQTGHYVASFNPITKDFKRYDLAPGTGPHNLIIAKEGMVWYAGNLKAHIGRLNPDTGEIIQYPMPNKRAKDPHTLVFDKQGNIWFTVQQGNFVGRLQMQSGKIDLINVPTSRARPYGIVIDRNARPWLVEVGSNKLATVDPKTLQIQEIELPREAARPRRLAITSDGRIWYVDYREGYLGQYSPETGKFKEWPVPSKKDSGPYGMAVDDKDRLWFVETWQSPNQMVGFDSKTETFFSMTPIPSGAGAVRHMYFNQASREIWFGTDSNTIGRVAVPN